jgi:hypothetical protein
MGVVELTVCNRVELMISKVEPLHYHSTTQRIIDPRDPTKTIVVPTLFDVAEDGTSALYEYLLSNLTPVEDLSALDRERLTNEDSLSLGRAHDIATELGIASV